MNAIGEIGRPGRADPTARASVTLGADGRPLSAYQYLVLRAVPRVDRGEFVNVGVVLHCEDAGFLQAATHVDTARLEALAPGFDAGCLADALETVSAACRGEAVAGLADDVRPGRRFGWLAAPRSTSLQTSPVHTGLTADPAGELARLLDTLVR